MRRSDEEFKAELLLRVEEYKVRQRKWRQNALRAASVTVMACLLVVSSQWGKIADENWYRPTESLGVTESVPETGEMDKTQEDSVTDAAKENESTTVPETDPVQEDVTDVPAVTAGLSGVSIWEQKKAYNEDATGSFDGTKNYSDEKLAEELMGFLTERIETAKEITEESTTVEKPESENPSAGNASSNTSLGKKYRVTIRYADGRAIAYQIAEGKSELKIKGGCLILDQESWGKLMQIVGNIPKN